MDARSLTGPISLSSLQKIWRIDFAGQTSCQDPAAARGFPLPSVKRCDQHPKNHPWKFLPFWQDLTISLSSLQRFCESVSRGSVSGCKRYSFNFQAAKKLMVVSFVHCRGKAINHPWKPAN